jgi:Phage integrase, N-terminal SAM-like domain
MRGNVIQRTRTVLHDGKKVKVKAVTWTAVWHTIDPATGKRVQHVKGGFPTKKSGVAYLNRTVGKVEEGTWKPDASMTVKQLLMTFWLPAKKTANKSANTIEQYRRVSEDWIIPNIGGLRVVALTPAIIDDLVTTLGTTRSAQGRDSLSPRSIQLAVTVLKMATKWASLNDYLSRDPLAGSPRPKAKSAVGTIWNEEQARACLAATRGDRLGFVWALALTRGFRRGGQTSISMDKARSKSERRG